MNSSHVMRKAARWFATSMLKVNMQYIESAAQADEYRTEPAFKLQGSYRDMNKIAEQMSPPMMNDQELQVLIRIPLRKSGPNVDDGRPSQPLLKL